MTVRVHVRVIYGYNTGLYKGVIRVFVRGSIRVHIRLRQGHTGKGQNKGITRVPIRV